MSDLKSAKAVHKVLLSLADPDIAEHSQRFFKTGKGEYGYGDIFLGIRVPVIRKQVKINREMELEEGLILLRSKYHEERLFAVLLLAHQFKQASEQQKYRIYSEYLAHTQFINSWDIVDSSAHLIVGAHLENKNKKPLYKLAKSKLLWERRIAIIATLHYIKNQDFTDTLAIAKILLSDEHDLIHKATGWMLREVGNRDKAQAVKFLNAHYKKMPRTMLRYALEKFPKTERNAYMKGLV